MRKLTAGGQNWEQDSQSQKDEYEMAIGMILPVAEILDMNRGDVVAMLEQAKRTLRDDREFNVTEAAVAIRKILVEIKDLESEIGLNKQI